ncbi:TPA: DUF739 family protein [Streptococcus suis]
MVYDYSKLEGKIIEKFGTRESFAKALGITTKSISDKLNNKTIWKQPEISKAKDLLSISGSETDSYFFKYKVQELEQK